MTAAVERRGPFFEDLEEGQEIFHGGRTITEADNIWFSLVTCNPNPLHSDASYAAQTEFGRMVVNSALTVAVATGLSVADISRNAVNLGWDTIKMSEPLYPGDTLVCESTVLECRPSQSRPSMGIVRVRTVGRNQEGVEVVRFERAVLIYRRGSFNQFNAGTEAT